MCIAGGVIFVNAIVLAIESDRPDLAILSWLRPQMTKAACSFAHNGADLHSGHTQGSDHALQKSSRSV